MEQKVPLIVWSGGVDSTLCLLNELKTNDVVDTVYFRLGNNSKQTRMELIAIKKIRKLLQKDNKIINLQIQEIAALPSNNNLFLPQPALWISNIVYFINSSRHNRIVFGYIKGDDFWHIKTEFESLYLNLCKIVCVENDSPSLYFPYEWWTKKQIKQEMKKKYKNVYKLISYCENPEEGKPCEKCGSCLQHKSA